IDMFDLLKAALRQRPEYIAVGEVRGQEATVLFQAMATGHAAYGTMHADSVEAVIHRLESDPINIPRSLIESLDVVSIQMQTRIGGKRVRRTKEIVEIVGLDPNTKDLLTNEVFRWDSATDTFEASGISYVLERLQLENNLTRQELQNELENRQIIIQWMIERGVRNYQEVARIVQSYYNEPPETMRKVRADLGLE
ncbi:MAG: ATPase, T2SS/T4P/T4SS family, partial [bacterium]